MDGQTDEQQTSCHGYAYVSHGKNQKMMDAVNTTPIASPKNF